MLIGLSKETYTKRYIEIYRHCDWGGLARTVVAKGRGATVAIGEVDGAASRPPFIVWQPCLQWMFWHV